MKRLIYLACILSLTLSTAQATMILFAGNTVGPPTAGADADVLAFLEDRYGMANVDYMRVNDVTAVIAETYDGVVASSTPSSGQIRNKFPNMNVGVLNYEEAVMDSGSGEFGMSTATMTKSTTTTMLSLVPHQITAGLPATLTFAASGETLSSSALFAGITPIATVLDGNGVGNTALFIAEMGDAVNPTAGTTGNIAQGRRVMFPITDATFNTLTPEGQQLFGQAVDWTAGVIPEPGSAGLMIVGTLVISLRRNIRA